MFQVEDLVLYGIHGICKIIDIKEDQKKYYVLQTFTTPNTTIFIPVDNEVLVSRMHKVLTVDDIKEIIQSNTIWIQDKNRRKEAYKKIIMSGDRKDLVRLIKTLFLKKEELKQEGKHLSSMDDNYFKEAKRMLYEEFAIVLKIEPDQVVPFILNKIELEEKL